MVRPERAGDGDDPVRQEVVAGAHPDRTGDWKFDFGSTTK